MKPNARNPAWCVLCSDNDNDNDTHSDEVTDGSQKPGSTDVSVGVIIPHKKNLLSLYALLSRQGGLLVLCIKTVHRVTSRKTKPTGVCCDKFI